MPTYRLPADHTSLAYFETEEQLEQLYGSLNEKVCVVYEHA